MYLSILLVICVACPVHIFTQDDKLKSRRVQRKHDQPSGNSSVHVSVYPRPAADGVVVSRRPSPSSSREMEQIEYRLTKLEVQVAEKAEHLRSELREGNRRLQALEWQGAEVQTALETFRNELGRFTETNQPPMTRIFRENSPNNNPTGQGSAAMLGKLETRIDNLAKGVQLAIAALRILNLDIAVVKRNISSIAEAASNLMLMHEELVTKPFLSTSLFDVKHHQQMYRHQAASCGGRDAEDLLPKNCKEVQNRGINASGIYRIQPDPAAKPFMVLCDLETKGGGWTFIHNRYEGTQDFYLDWNSYKQGFGNLGGEFWLGLEHIHQLTGFEVNELLVELVDMSQEKAEAHYGAFSVGSEVEGYALKILGGYRGDAGDSLVYHAGSKFSTKDMDQDGWTEGSCAQSHEGAWWYRSCDASNLNGKYLNGPLPEDYTYHGMYWGEFHGAQYSLMQARIMVRPRNDDSTTIFPQGMANTRNRK